GGGQPYRVPVAGRDGHHIPPALHVALPLVVVACSHHGAVGLEPYRAPPAGRDGHDVPPVRDITLPVLVPPHRRHRAIGPQANGVGAARVGTAGGHRDHVPPVVY